MTDASLLRMIERIYDAAGDQPAMTSFAGELSREFGCDMALLYVVQGPLKQSTDLLLSATASFDDWAHSSYTGYYRRYDIWSLRLLARRHAVMHGLDVIDRAVLRKSQAYEYCQKVGIGHVLIGTFGVAKDVGVVNMSRPERARDFDGHDKRRLEFLVPHVQRAVQIQQRLSTAEQQRSLTQEVLERLDLGTLVLGRNARLLFANAVARRVLQAGRDLTVAHGCVRPRHAAQLPQFEKAVHDAALTSVGEAARPGGFVALLRPEGAPLSLLISPFRAFPGTPGYGHGTALIVFSDPDARTDAPEQAIAKMFGLAPAQARLVAALVAGETMADYADSVGISMNTAKTQMRQIFLKTGVNRQADLIRAVAANPLVKLGREIADS
jgi:DNA-binding CsgD family transcriptional regulator